MYIEKHLKAKHVGKKELLNTDCFTIILLKILNVLNEYVTKLVLNKYTPHSLPLALVYCCEYYSSPFHLILLPTRKRKTAERLQILSNFKNAPSWENCFHQSPTMAKNIIPLTLRVSSRAHTMYALDCHQSRALRSSNNLYSQRAKPMSRSPR